MRIDPGKHFFQHTGVYGVEGEAVAKDRLFTSAFDLLLRGWENLSDDQMQELLVTQ